MFHILLSEKGVKLCDRPKNHSCIWDLNQKGSILVEILQLCN